MGAMSHPRPPLSRRDVLAGAAAAAALAASGGPVSAEEGAAPPPAPRIPDMPACFVGHGSPMLALNPTKGAELTRWTARYEKPVAVLSISAHFQLAPVSIGATKRLPLVYDFRGFPEALYKVRYPAPGAPKLARRVRECLEALGPVEDYEERGHDHGTWVPLRWMYPRADVPVLSISLPTHDPRKLFEMGRALAPLRKEGVLILGSGNMTHNGGGIPGKAPPAWAAEFDAWSKEVLVAGDVDALLDWQRKAPAARRNHPTVEHFVPLLIAAGARRRSDKATFPVTGWEGGSFSRRCVAFGPA
jgi:4,5-DOPA dioxygenase extradiol